MVVLWFGVWCEIEKPNVGIQESGQETIEIVYAQNGTDLSQGDGEGMESVDRRNMRKEMPRLVTEQIRRTTEMEELFAHSTFVSTVNMPAIAGSSYGELNHSYYF